MIPKNNPFGLYIVATNPRIGYVRLAECCVRMGVPMLQLRDKCLDDRQLLSVAREIRQITRGSSTKFVINDRADIAVLSDADCLHVGLSDIPLEDAVKIVGDMEIGVSAETVEEAISLDIPGVSYIGAGPVFATPTKSVPVPPLGLEGLEKIVHAVSKPIVAIGGIFPSNLDSVRKTGALGWAMVRQFMAAENESELEKAIRECLV